MSLIAYSSWSTGSERSVRPNKDAFRFAQERALIDAKELSQYKSMRRVSWDNHHVHFRNFLLAYFLKNASWQTGRAR